MKSNALAPTKPIQSASLEPSWPKIAPNICLSWSFVDLGYHFGCRKIQKSIPKSRYFQASLETCFFTIGDPKSVKTRFQNHPKIKLFLESDKTTESCSRLPADLVFTVWKVPKSHFVWNHFRKPSHAALEPLFFRFLIKMMPQRVSRIVPKSFLKWSKKQSEKNM